MSLMVESYNTRRKRECESTSDGAKIKTWKVFSHDIFFETSISCAYQMNETRAVAANTFFVFFLSTILFVACCLFFLYLALSLFHSCWYRFFDWCANDDNTIATNGSNTPTTKTVNGIMISCHVINAIHMCAHITLSFRLRNSQWRRRMCESWRDTDHVGFLLLSFYVTSLSFIYVFIFFHFTFAPNDNKNERVPGRLCADPILYFTLSLMAKAIYVAATAYKWANSMSNFLFVRWFVCRVYGKNA